MNDPPKEPKEYYTIEGSTCKCTLCDYSGAKSNVIRHLHAKHSELNLEQTKYRKIKNVKNMEKEESRFIHHTESGKEVPMDQHLVDIVVWKTTHNISMNAITDETFKNKIAAHTEAILSRGEMRTRINEIAAQLIDETREVLRNEIISVVIDGGTINSYSYYALGGVMWNHLNKQLCSRLLDVIICNQSSTTQHILNMFSESISKINKGNLVIASVCSDNAKNISSGFMNTHKIQNPPKSAPDYTPLPYLRISCAVHTLNLIISDFVTNDKELILVYKEIKRIANVIKTMARRTKFDLKILGFPKIQEQRWNSLYLVFDYLDVHYDDVKTAFDDFAVRQDDISKYKRLLEPHAMVITKLESDSANQVSVYKECCYLKNEWLAIEAKYDYSEVRYLISRYDFHTLYTMDLRISMLAYYVTKGGLKEWRKKYPMIVASVSLSEADKKQKTNSETNLNLLRDTAENLTSIWGIPDISSGLAHYLYTTTFADASFIFPTEEELRRSELNAYNEEYCSMFIDFIQRIRVLPSSEAQSERIFASMRELVSDKQKRLNEESIRSEAIIKLSKDRIVQPTKAPARIHPINIYLQNHIDEDQESDNFDETWNDP